MVDHLSCGVWADVDFGHGPVEIRCTKIGEHEHHACNVMMQDPHRAPVSHAQARREDHLRKNVFEGGKDG